MLIALIQPLQWIFCPQFLKKYDILSKHKKGLEIEDSNVEGGLGED